MKRALLLSLLAGLGLATACADLEQPTSPTTPRVAAGLGTSPTTVMTRNLYLGADIDALIKPGANPAEVLPQALAQLTLTDYPARAYFLAAEIAARQPGAVGLQEVTHYKIELQNGGVIEYDFLDLLQYFLMQAKTPYVVGIRNNNVSLPITVGAAGVSKVTYTDGDAILVRPDVVASDPAAGHFIKQEHLTVPGLGGFDNLRGWTAITLQENGYKVRFVNTHLEIQAFRSTQEQQARELAALLAGETLPIVLVGDFNSAANPSAPAGSKTDSYHILRNAGFADLELREPHSNTLVTCCHLADLSDEVPNFDQRLDLVLARWGKAGFGGQSAVEVVTGQRFFDTDHYLWPSDHAAVFAQLWPAPGLLR